MGFPDDLEKIKDLKDFPMYMYKFDIPNCGPHPLPGDHDLNKLIYTLTEGASTEV